MRKADVWATVDRERSELADLLPALTPEQWAVQSLCAGWSVREVVAHLTLTDIGPLQVTAELARYGFSLSRTARETARRRARALTTDELVDRMRGMVGQRRHPIGTTHLEPLVDVLVHWQDIAVPLGIDREMPNPAAAVAAERVARMAYWSGKRRLLKGVRLEATDAEWSFGTGEVVRGPIAVLLLLMTGRRVRLDEVVGKGADQLLRTAS
jgi:uncharacterized protein (TIGR03083 family)